MTVKEIIYNYLKAHGFNGLCSVVLRAGMGESRYETRHPDCPLKPVEEKKEMGC